MPVNAAVVPLVRSFLVLAAVAAALFAVLLAAVFAVVAAALSDVAAAVIAAVAYTALRLNAAALALFVGVLLQSHVPGINARAGHFLAAAIEFAAFQTCALSC